MIIDRENLLRLDNENFIKTCFSLLQEIGVTEKQLLPLLDKEVANEVIKDRYGYTYPIIKEITSANKNNIIDMYFVKGSRRYYNEIHYLNGKSYILSNDWYYPSEGKKNVKDNRTQFLKWLEPL